MNHVLYKAEVFYTDRQNLQPIVRQEDIMAQGTYITNPTHFFNSDGDIPKDLPREAREFANFLALIFDKVTSSFPQTNREIDTGIRCRKKGCQGLIIGALEAIDEPVHWYCLDCGHHRVISNWRRSKWDNT